MTFPAVVTALMVSAAMLAPAAQQPSQKDRDLQEVLNYRLSTTVLEKLSVVHETLAAEMASDPEFRRLQSLRRERDALSRKDELTDAEAERLETLEAELEQIEDEEEAEDSLLGADDPSSLSELAAQIEAEPRLAAAIAKSGMTAREFATAQLALFNAAIAHGFMKSGLIKELPPGVSKENVEFISQHEAEITAMSDRWDELEP